MEWEPLHDDGAGRVRAVLREIVEGVDAAPADDRRGSIGDRALLHAYLSQDGTIADSDVIGRSVAEAVSRFATGGRSPSLYGGAAGVGWLVEHLAGGETAEQVCALIDARLLDALTDWTGDYDLIIGLAGFGVYALEHGEAGRPLASRVLDVLAATATPRDGGLAWRTRPELLPPWQRERTPEGYWNLGLSHGIPGVIALLARYVRHDVEAVRAGELLDRATTYLLRAEPGRDAGRYPSWHPTTDPPTRRLAWCYNDLGVSLALYAAAVARGRDDWRAEALALAHRCAVTPLAEAGLVDCGLCHGAAGAMHLFNRLYHASGDPVFRTAALRWLDHTFELRRSDAIAGFPSSSPEMQWTPDASLLTGATGVALALHAMISEVEPSWDRVMLVDF